MRGSFVFFISVAIIGFSGCNTLIHSKEQDCSKGLKILENDLKETRQVLIMLIRTLLDSKYDPMDIEAGDEDGLRRRRELADDNDHILSQLPISSLLGLRGKDGKDGRDGRNGQDGKDGAQGIMGIPGRDGNNGRDGKDGVAGKDGAPGERGLQGEKGNTGASGLSGQKGAPGINGMAGPPGAPGQSGQEGRSGATGRDGAAGGPGPKGAPGKSVENGGAAYIRWGRTSCGNRSTLLYAGFAAGTSYLQTGGEVNYQCMPPSPEYNAYSSGDQYCPLGGAEYESYSYGIFPNQIFDKNVPCAQCYTNTRPAVTMIPAKRTCLRGWTKEYEGYLMTERGAHPHPATFECVDSNPEYISGSASNTDGALFYFVKPICSGRSITHHCPPYINGRELTCVVCSK